MCLDTDIGCANIFLQMVLQKVCSGKICFQTNLLKPMNRKGKGKVGWFFFIHHLSEAPRKFLQVFSWKIYHDKQGWKHLRNICNLTTSLTPLLLLILRCLVLKSICLERKILFLEPLLSSWSQDAYVGTIEFLLKCKLSCLEENLTIITSQKFESIQV